MRPLVPLLLGLLSLASTAQADPKLRFYAEHPKVSTNFGLYLIVANEGNETARDIRIGMTLEPGIEFHESVSTSAPAGDCTNSKTIAQCNIPSLAANDLHVIGFTLVSADRSGGHRALTATMNARALPSQTATMDVVTPKFIDVTAGSDFGAGSLRAAIEEVNEHPFCGTDVTCVIAFSGPMTIAPATPLPPIRKCNVRIQGLQDPWPHLRKHVEISGANATHGNGLEIRLENACDGPSGPLAILSGVDVNALSIHSWPWNGILIDAQTQPNGNAASYNISEVYIGTDGSGLPARPNGSRGVVMDDPDGSLSLYRGVVSANKRSGIALFRGESAHITGMRIGTDRNEGALGNGASGIFSFGVPLYAGSNVIAFNEHFGIALTPGISQAWIEQSVIHSNGNLPIDWGLDGRTMPDDETDGVPNTPQLIDAVYDPVLNQTVARGVVRLRGGTTRDIVMVDLHVVPTVRGDMTRGGAILRTHLGTGNLPAGTTTDVPFEFIHAGNLHGHLLAVQTHALSGQAGMRVSSEVSEALKVR